MTLPGSRPALRRVLDAVIDRAAPIDVAFARTYSPDRIDATIAAAISEATEAAALAAALIEYQESARA